MQKLFPFILIFSFIVHSLAHAVWSENVRKEIESTAKAHFVQGPPGYVALWGGIKRSWKGGDLNGEVKKIALPGLMKKNLPVYFYPREEKAPLSIFFPGIFGHYDGQLSPNLVSMWERKKSHTAVIPNLFSKDYIMAQPIYKEDVTQTDIAVAVEVFKDLYRPLKDKITHVNLVAESLGSFVASATLTELQKMSEFKHLHFNLVLLWPPLELQKVLNNFDQEIKASLPVYKNCSFWYRYPIVFYHFYLQDRPKGIDSDLVTCMDSYLYHGVFGEGIKKSIKAYGEVIEKEIDPLPATFNDYFQIYNKDFYSMIVGGDKKLKLQYWLSQVDMKRSSLRIISSQDDFINKGLDWNKLLKDINLTEKNLILLSWGSHSGGMALPIWESVFAQEIIAPFKTLEK